MRKADLEEHFLKAQTFAASLPAKKRRANFAPDLDDALASTRPSKRLCRAATTLADVTCEGETSEHLGGGGQETCGWTGKLGVLAEHLAECRFAVTKCTLAGCSAKVPRKDVGAHEAECVWRGGECERCGVSFSLGEPRARACEVEIRMSALHEDLMRAVESDAARECKWQPSESHQIVPRDTLLEGTVKVLAESVGALHQEVSQTSSCAAPSDILLAQHCSCLPDAARIHAGSVRHKALDIHAALASKVPNVPATALSAPVPSDTPRHRCTLPLPYRVGWFGIMPVRPDGRRRHLADLRAAIGAELPGDADADTLLSSGICEMYAAHFEIHGGGCARDGPRLPAFHVTFLATGETCCDTAEYLRAWTLSRLEDHRDLRAGLIPKKRPASASEDRAEGCVLPGGGKMRKLMPEEFEELSSSSDDE
ncbi:hypothetical protein T484DRAFT_1823153 [Baffinella frigidus]|nr:hypothetical protein T484DRAFT_1823153 [Cryptophyta sp. CCMP2293]